MRVLLAVAFLAVALGGCVTPQEANDTPTKPTKPIYTIEDLSAPVFDILPVVEEFVTTSDGVRVHNAIYAPDTNESVPVFINFSPYWGNTAETGGDNFASYMVNEYVPRGYAVILSAVRGTGHSESCFHVAGDRELEDMYDVVDYYAKQEWTNGKIAAGGKSYDSTTQNGMIAKFPHDALKGIFHVSGITDMYRYNAREGITYSNGITFTPRYAQGQGSAGDHPDGEPSGTIDSNVCQEMAEHVTSGTATAADGQKDAYWQERDWNRYIGQSAWNGSIFFVHGFQDWNVKPDHILPWLDLLPEQIRLKVWLHQDTYNTGHVYPMRDDWNQTMLRWLDHELKGIDTGLYDEPTYNLRGSDQVWRYAESWPPEMAESPVAADGFVLQATNQTLRYTGQPSITMTVTPLTEDAAVTAVLYEETNGQRIWRNGAVLRLLYAEGMDAPTPYAVGLPMTVTADFYTQDDVLPVGSKWVVEFGVSPGRGLVFAPGQLEGVQYGAATIHLPMTSTEMVLEPQPGDMECFAC